MSEWAFFIEGTTTANSCHELLQSTMMNETEQHNDLESLILAPGWSSTLFWTVSCSWGISGTDWLLCSSEVTPQCLLSLCLVVFSMWNTITDKVFSNKPTHAQQIKEHIHVEFNNLNTDKILCTAIWKSVLICDRCTENSWQKSEQFLKFLTVTFCWRPALKKVVFPGTWA
jgi:hypothetical protein